MRTGRLPAGRLGLGTLFNKDLTAGRRILYWVTATTTTGEYTFSIARATHYMSTIEAAFVMPFWSGNGTGSTVWTIKALASGGTASFIEETGTRTHKQRYAAVLYGTPHTTYIVD